MQEAYNYTDGVYNCDAFNEQVPQVNTNEYVASVSRNIFQTLQAGDPQAIW